MNTVSPAAVRAPTLGDVPFEFLNAKVRGRRSLLYEGTRLRELARERTVADLAWRLYPREDIRSRLALENRVVSACVAELASLAAYLSGAYLALYRSLLSRYVVENLKVLLRLYLRGGDLGEAAELLIELPRGFFLPAHELMASADVTDFVGRVPLLPVRQHAQGVLPLYRKSRHRAYLEMAFDKGYWAGVWEGVRQLPFGERRRCSAPVRSEFDALRLLATVRAAATYGIPWEDWEALMPVGPGAIGEGALRRIHATPTLASVLENVPSLKGLLSDEVPARGSGDIGPLERALWHRTLRLVNRQYYGTTSGPAVLVSYFYLKRNELRQLLGLTQMLTYGAEEQEIIEYLEL